MLTGLFDPNRRNLIAPALLLLVILSATVGWITLRAQPFPLPSAEHQKYLGQQIAQHVQQIIPEGQIVLLVLFASNSKPYAACIEDLKTSLPSDLHIIGQVYPLDESIYDDDDYTASIDLALSRYPQADLLCVISAGSVSHASVSSPLVSFLESGGKLVMVGQIMHPDSPFVYLADQGYATIIARRSGWLKDGSAPAAPKRSDSPKDHFRRNYVILPD